MKLPEDQGKVLLDELRKWAKNEEMVCRLNSHMAKDGSGCEEFFALLVGEVV